MIQILRAKFHRPFDRPSLEQNIKSFFTGLCHAAEKNLVGGYAGDQFDGSATGLSG